MIATLRIAALMMFSAVGSTALAAADDCNATTQERIAHLGTMIIMQLDRGAGESGYPVWMREVMQDPDDHAERITQFCAASPEVKLSAALERMYEAARDHL